ncbi:MAG: 50S ribosomal protein L5 [Deltaproteobacteria bacterium]|nr:50S ribosomal protein L5 [Deltaproteobacteria bacterium]
MAKDTQKKDEAGAKSKATSSAKSGGAKKAKGEAVKAKGADKKQSKSAKSASQQPAREAPPPRLLIRYRNEIVPNLVKEHGYKNVMQVPRITKVTINMGLGEAVSNPNAVTTSVEELGQIAGQKAVVTRARKSISNFKLRVGLSIGCMVTLRNARMWEFLDRLMNIAIPRVRDFKGVSGRAFDGRGNYSLGIREQIIFPEINYDKVDKVRGMNITITTTAKNDKEGKALLKHLGMPFRN